jgi:hypothetical protein
MHISNLDQDVPIFHQLCQLVSHTPTFLFLHFNILLVLFDAVNRNKVSIH